VYHSFNQAKCKCRPSYSPNHAVAIDLSSYSQLHPVCNLKSIISSSFFHLVRVWSINYRTILLSGMWGVCLQAPVLSRASSKVERC
jgi:hypothetical protein